ncbi:MAG: hypothetical protein Q9190_006106 [Brigantiaea leucoxantha]
MGLASRSIPRHDNGEELLHPRGRETPGALFAEDLLRWQVVQQDRQYRSKERSLILQSRKSAAAPFRYSRAAARWNARLLEGK